MFHCVYAAIGAIVAPSIECRAALRFRLWWAVSQRHHRDASRRP